MGSRSSSQQDGDASAAGAPPGARSRRPWLWTQLKVGYSDLVDAIIRPPRAEYSMDELGPMNFQLRGRHYERSDFQIRNAHGLNLECSWWQPIPSERLRGTLPCVVYMHGNSSCRLEALDELPLVLQSGVTLLAFDFAGCGQSEGDHVTLGYREKDDAKAVVDFLRRSGWVSTIALWGRSMGAATALLHGHRDPSIAGLILDSSFTSLKRLALEIVEQAQMKHVPSVLINAFLKMMRSSVRKRTGLDILKLEPIKDVDTCFIPAVFVAALGDRFISPQHTRDICERYAGEKSMLMVEGGHNARRPAYFMNSVSSFIYNRLCAPVGLTEEAFGLRAAEATPPNLLRTLLSLGRRSDEVVAAAGASAANCGDRSQEKCGDGDEEQEPGLQQALLMSMASTPDAAVSSQEVNPDFTSPQGNLATRLVGCATSEHQCTLPKRRQAATKESRAAHGGSCGRERRSPQRVPRRCRE